MINVSETPLHKNQVFDICDIFNSWVSIRQNTNVSGLDILTIFELDHKGWLSRYRNDVL